MREGVSKHRCLLGVQLYELSTNYMYEIREKQKNANRIFEGSLLPEYTINTNKEANNRPIKTDYFLQFVGVFKPENYEANIKYSLFDVNTLDQLLDYEISNSGFDDLFKECDFKKLLSVFKPNTDEDMKHMAIPTTNYLVVEIIYTTTQDFYSGGWECESEIDVIGYLDSQMQLKKFENSLD